MESYSSSNFEHERINYTSLMRLSLFRELQFFVGMRLIDDGIQRVQRHANNIFRL